MNDLPPELRQALIQLALEAIRELMRLLAELVAQVIGVRTLPLTIEELQELA